MKKHLSKWLSTLLSIALVIGLCPIGAYAANHFYSFGPFRLTTTEALTDEENLLGIQTDYDVKYKDGVLYINTSKWIQIANSNTTDARIVVEHNANLTLAGVDISSSKSALKINDGKTVSLQIFGTDSLVSSEDSGIHVGQDAKLTITGNGVLNARGGSGGSGIGGGKIIVDMSGTVNATGSAGGAGIGHIKGSVYQSIEIKNGEIHATGGDTGAGIGGKAKPIGSSIIISGGQIKATAGAGAAAIGSEGSVGSKVSITGGMVTASGGAHSINPGNALTGASVVIGSNASVKALSINGTPKDASGNEVELKVVNNPDLASIMIDGEVFPYRQHFDEKKVYIYAPADAEPQIMEGTLYAGDFIIKALCDDFSFSTLSFDNVTGRLTVNTDKPFSIQNADPSAPTKNSILIPAGQNADITLAGVNIAEPTAESALVIGNQSRGNVTLTLAEGTENKLIAGNANAAIRKQGENTGRLTVKGSGSLYAEGGNDAPAIGGTFTVNRYNAENILLESGIITLKGNGAPSINGDYATKGIVIYPDASVKASGSSAFGTQPVNGYGEPVYLLAHENSAAEELSIDGTPVGSPGHGSEDTRYFYVTGNGHYIDNQSGERTFYRFVPDTQTFEIYDPSSGIDTGDFTVTGGTPGVDYTYTDGVLTILSAEHLTVANTDPSRPTSHRIVLQAAADLTLDGLNIDCSGLEAGTAAITIPDGFEQDVTITSAPGSENILKASAGSAALRKNGGTQTGTLQFEGSGRIEVFGGAGGAGIGSDSGKDTANIVIDGGIVVAHGNGAESGSGIGAGAGGSAENIVIKNGTVTGTAEGGGNGIGSGSGNKTNGVEIYPTASVKAIMNFEPVTLLNGNPAVCGLVEIDNPTGGDVYINDELFPLKDHDGEKKLYVYLTDGEYEIRTDSDTKTVNVSVSTGDFIVTGGTVADATYAGGVLTINTDRPLTIANKDQSKATSHHILIKKDVNAHITLNGVNISSVGKGYGDSADAAAIAIEDDSTGNVTISLAEGSVNKLVSGYVHAGIEKDGLQGTLTIEGDGKLDVKGGMHGAGIGAGCKYETEEWDDVVLDIYSSYDVANIFIQSGDITIRNVTAGSAGIGGGGSRNDFTVQNIVIEGGNVKLDGTGGDGVGIGGDYHATYKDIKILGGTVTITRPVEDSIYVNDENIVVDHKVSLKMNKKVTGKMVDASGASVYLYTIANPDAEPVYINNELHPQTVHSQTDTNLYVYLPAVDQAAAHKISAGGNTVYIYYDSTDKAWKELEYSYSVTPAETVYTGADQPAASFSGTMPAGASIAYSLEEDGTYTEQIPTVRDAGEYTLWYVVTDALGKGPVQSVTVKVEKQPLSVTAKDKTIVYGDLPDNDGVSFEGFAGGEDESVLGGNAVFDYDYAQYDDAGIYDIKPSGYTSDNYDLSYVPGTLTVEKKELSASDVVISNTGTVLYDGQAHTAGAALRSDLSGAGQFSLSYTTDGAVFVTEAVEEGDYKIYLRAEEGDNFCATTGDGIDTGKTLTIWKPFVPEELTADMFTVKAENKVCDGTTSAAVSAELTGEPDITVAVSGSFEDAKAGSGKTVNYTITSISGSGAENYKMTAPISGSTEADISRAQARVSADTQKTVYSGQPAEFAAEAAVEGFSGDINDQIVYTHSADGGSSFADGLPVHAGSYVVRASVAEDDYHTAASAEADLTIEKMEISFTAGTVSFDYDGQPHPVSISAFDSNGGAFTDFIVRYCAEGGLPGTEVPSDAGDYTVSVELGNRTDYFTAQKDIQMRIEVISQDKLTILGVPGTVVFGDEFTLSAEGGSGDGSITWSSDSSEVTVDEFSGLVSVSGAVGQTVTITAEKAADANHQSMSESLSFVPAPKPVSFTLEDLEQDYDGASRSVSVIPSDADATYTVSYDGSTAVPGVPGVYAVEVYANGNYTGSKYGMLIINQGIIRGVEFVQEGGVYGMAIPDPVITSAAGFDTVLSYGQSGSSKPVNAGSYTAELTVSAEYYQPLVLTSDFVIEKAVLTATPSDATRYTGQPNPAVTIQYSGWKYDDDESVLLGIPVVSFGADEQSPAGEYTISLSRGYAQNYDLSYGTAVLTVENAQPVDPPSPPSGGGGGGAAGGSEGEISINKSFEHGKLTSDCKTAPAGQTVILTAAPDEGFALESLKVTDRKDRELAVTDLGNGHYCFTMPYGAVKVDAAFAQAAPVPVIPEEGYAGCLKDDNCIISRFTDVDLSAWYHDGIHYCVEHGLMEGISDTVFRPDGTTTRAQIVTILYRLEGEPAFRNDNVFDDVETGSWYEKAVVWAQGKGIVSGYGNGSFGPGDPVTREQMAQIFYNYASYKGYDTSVSAGAAFSGFSDADSISAYARTAMAWAVKKGLIQGSGSRLDPRGSAVRAQAAAILQRYCENIVE